MADLITVAALVIGILMLSTWVFSVVINDASIVDVVWGLGFVMAAWAAYLSADVDTATDRSLLMLGMVTVWGLRLTVFLGRRHVGRKEDRRHQQMRKRHPDSFWLVSLYQVFAPQALLMFVVSIPPVVTIGSESRLSWLDFVGAGVWSVGLVIETVGDLQLNRFRSGGDSKTGVMDRGLWHYSRHPNYFGDFLVWWGVYLVAAAGGAWWTVFSPLIMSALLIRYTGARLMEETIIRRRPGYADYITRTNGFFPGPPKKGTQGSDGSAGRASVTDS